MQLEEVIAKAQAEIESVNDVAALEELRVQYMGKGLLHRADEEPGQLACGGEAGGRRCTH